MESTIGVFLSNLKVAVSIPLWVDGKYGNVIYLLYLLPVSIPLWVDGKYALVCPFGMGDGVSIPLWVDGKRHYSRCVKLKCCGFNSLMGRWKVTIPYTSINPICSFNSLMGRWKELLLYLLRGSLQMFQFPYG